MRRLDVPEVLIIVLLIVLLALWVNDRRIGKHKQPRAVIPTPPRPSRLGSETPDRVSRA